MNINNLKIKIFADGADIESMLKAKEAGIVKGFTTNPSLMKKAGVKNYEHFAKEVLSEIRDLPVSFEVLSDDFETMEREARRIASWAENVYIKIPITSTKGQSSISLIKKLTKDGFKINITAILSSEQIIPLYEELPESAIVFISIFAGRIADTGRDPIPHMRQAVDLFRDRPDSEILWASPRELLNIFQAESIGCNIITVMDEILNKLHLIGKDLNEFSLETVKMFYIDSMNAEYKLV